MTTAEHRASPPVLELGGVGLRRNGNTILDGVDWRIDADQNWVVLGANGSGKTSLIRIAALYDHPSNGTVRVLGETLGSTDVRRLRRRVALVSTAMSDLLRPELSAADIVMCAKNAALEPWWHDYDDADRHRAEELLHAQGIRDRARSPYRSLSSGERQRVMLARALMAQPGLLLLDEPNAGLDLAGREDLIDRLDTLTGDAQAPPMALVTHHVEEIPPGFTHLLVLRDGKVLASGPIEDTLNAEVLSVCFAMDLEVSRHDGGRWSARRAG